MTYDWIIGSLSVLVGGWLAIHCPRAALSEFRAGVARGRVNSFVRDRNPAAFWLAIAATAFAGVIGFCFLLYGIALLGMGAGLMG